MYNYPASMTECEKNGLAGNCGSKCSAYGSEPDCYEKIPGLFKLQFRRILNDVVVGRWYDYTEIPPKVEPEDLISACELFYSRHWGVKIEFVIVGWEGNLFEMKVMGRTHNKQWQFRIVPISVEGADVCLEKTASV